MSYDPTDDLIDDAMLYDAWRDDEAERFEERIWERISEYKLENLRDSFSGVGSYIRRVTATIQLAKDLAGAEFYSHSVIASHTAIECTLRDLLIRPLLLGIVLDEDLAGVVSETILSDRRTTKYDAVISSAVKKFSGIELSSYTTPVGRKLWGGIKLSRERRNLAVHRGEELTRDDAYEAFALAETLLESVYAQVLYGLDLDEIAESIQGVKGYEEGMDKPLEL